MDYEAALLAVALGVYVAVRRDWSRTVVFMLGGLPAAVILGIYDTIAFGSPLRLSYRYEVGALRGAASRLLLALGGRLISILAKTAVGNPGLLTSSPVLAAAAVGLVLLLLRGLPSRGRSGRRSCLPLPSVGVELFPSDRRRFACTAFLRASAPVPPARSSARVRCPAAGRVGARCCLRRTLHKAGTHLVQRDVRQVALNARVGATHAQARRRRDSGARCTDGRSRSVPRHTLTGPLTPPSPARARCCEHGCIRIHCQLSLRVQPSSTSETDQRISGSANRDAGAVVRPVQPRPARMVALSYPRRVPRTRLRPSTGGAVRDE